MFKTTYLKLTLFYVLVVMAISVSFSFALYNISSKELDKGLGRQTVILRGLPMPGLINQSIPDLEELRMQQLDESSNRLRLNLIYFNLLILLLSSLFGYILAKKTLEPIEESVLAQNRFTADASHELRTPLTAMKTEIEVSLLDNQVTAEEMKNTLKSNLEEIEKLEELSNSLLKLATLQEGRALELEDISVEDIIVEAYEKVESIARKKHITFNNDLKDLHVMGEKQSLVELFVILLENAIKYSSQKSYVSINTEKVRDFVVVKVKDKGIGINASDIPFIFNRFYRADTSRSKEKINGYGLGLSIAKKIIDLHRGSISVSSKPGQGSEFTVKIPSQ